MDERKPSITALGAATRRAIHQLVDADPKVFVDPLAVRLVAAAGPGMIAAYLAAQSPADRPSSRAARVLRSRVTEDELSVATAVDFDQQTLTEGLAAAGFDARQPAFVSWLGVTQYLTLPAIDATLRVVAALPAPSCG